METRIDCARCKEQSIALGPLVDDPETYLLKRGWGCTPDGWMCPDCLEDSRRGSRRDIGTMERQVADHFGFYSQSRMCMEEAAELIQAICKYCRAIIYFKDEDAEGMARLPEYRQIIEELADTRIMIDQMEYLLGCKAPVHAIMYNKLIRTLTNMEEESE